MIDEGSSWSCPGFTVFSMQLRVPRQPYVKGHLFKLTTDYLLYKHSTVTDYPESAHPADEGDSVLLQVCLTPLPLPPVCASCRKHRFSSLKGADVSYSRVFD